MYKSKFPEIYNSNKSRLDMFMKECKIPEPIQQFIYSLTKDTDYFEAPASTKYHGAYPGGLLDHSMNVAIELKHYADLGLIAWERPYSPYIVGLLHDFCKVNQYTIEEWINWDDSKEYDIQYNPEHKTFGGHGVDSLCKILLKVPLTEEESLCIRWHMGPYETDQWENYDKAIKAYPNVLWTHHADMVVSKIKEANNNEN